MVSCKSSSLLVVAANSDCMVPSKGSSMGCCCGGLELIIMLWMVQLRLLSFLRLIGGFDSIICDSTMSIEDQLSSSAGRRLVFMEKFLDLMVASEKLEELFDVFFILIALSYCFTRDGESLMSFFSSFYFQTNLAPRCSSSKAERTAFSTSFILFLISRQQSSSCFLSIRLFLREAIRCCTSASIFFICSWTDFACRCSKDSDREGASMLLGYSCFKLSFPLIRLIMSWTSSLSLSRSSQRGRLSWFLTSNFLNHRHKYLTSSRRSLEQKLGMSLISACLMRSIILNSPTGRFYASFTGKSRSKAQTSQMTQPSDHTSALNPQSCESTISGAIQDGVPAEVLQC